MALALQALATALPHESLRLSVVPQEILQIVPSALHGQMVELAIVFGGDLLAESIRWISEELRAPVVSEALESLTGRWPPELLAERLQPLGPEMEAVLASAVQGLSNQEYWALTLAALARRLPEESELS